MDANLLVSILDSLEPHLSLVLLEKEQSKNTVDAQTAATLKLKYLGKTHLFSRLKEALVANSSLPKEKVQEIVSRVDALENKAQAQKAELESSASITALKNAIGTKYEEFSAAKFSKEVLEAQEEIADISMSRTNLSECIHYTRLLFNSGEYDTSMKCLNILYSIVDDPADILNVVWAKMANLLISAIKGDQSIASSIPEEFRLLKQKLDLKSVQVQAQRISLMCAFLYYTLVAFIYIPHKEQKFDFIFELFLEDRTLSAVQMGAPSLLRYLVLVYMMSYEKRTLKVDYRTLTNLIRSEVCPYSDTFTEFIKTLYIKFDLAGIRGHIEHISKEVQKDIIFSQYEKPIVEGCRKMYFEVYSKIYSSIDSKTAAQFLNLSPEETEIWLVNLFRKNNIKATVDPLTGTLALGRSPTDDGEGLNKKAKELMARNKILLSNVGKVLDHK